LSGTLPPRLGIDQQGGHDDVVDLNFNYPSRPEQGDLLRAALRRIAAGGDLAALLRYQPHGGRPHEREIAAGHLSHRGIAASPRNVLIVDGAQHGLATMAMALLKPGDLVAMDALTYPGFKVLAQSFSLEWACCGGWRRSRSRLAFETVQDAADPCRLRAADRP
jgi:DNA-binding transcriptional MocR family regulator